MTHDRYLQRSSSKISMSASGGPMRDDRFGWLLYLFGGRTLLGGAFSLLLGFVLLGGTGDMSRADGSLPFMMLFIIYGLYQILIGICVLSRLRIGWVLLVLTQVFSLLFDLLTLGVASVAAMAQQLNHAAGSEFLGGSYLSAAVSVAVLIFLLGRKNWFYR